ncbi:hypothetical protein H4Q26_010763 [Puccinia striiformis f. sp. tritici PST-130]|nr:hypothetical protein H4Q26_010763 [Puccinia striiformis f. sp. tritici PST-130]
MENKSQANLSARSKRRRAGRKRAGELAPKLEAANSHREEQLSKRTTKTLALRIADPKEDIVRTLASQITDSLVAGEFARADPKVPSQPSDPSIPRLDISNEGTNEDEIGADGHVTALR